MVTGRIHLKIAVINKGQICQTERVAKGFSTIRITDGSTDVPNPSAEMDTLPQEDCSKRTHIWFPVKKFIKLVNGKKSL